jgi:hypothetical protein
LITPFLSITVVTVCERSCDGTIRRAVPMFSDGSEVYESN